MATLVFVSAPASAAVRIVGPTAGRFVSVVSPGPDQQPMLSDGVRWLVTGTADGRRYMVVDARGSRKRLLRRGCAPAAAIRSVFLLLCGADSQIRLLFPGSGQLRSVTGVRRGDAFGYDFGRYWIFANRPHRVANCAAGGRCVYYTSYYVNWHTGRRVSCPRHFTHDRGPCSTSPADVNSAHLRPYSPRDDAAAREGRYSLSVVGQGLTLHGTGRPVQLATTHFLCGVSLLDRWVTWMPDCGLADPPRLLAYSIATHRRVRWTITGVKSSQYLRTESVDAARAGNVIFVEVLRSATGPADARTPGSYRLYAVPLPASRQAELLTRTRGARIGPSPSSS